MTWTIERSDKFKKNYKKLPQNVQKKLKEVLRQFSNDPFYKNLNTHKLKGKLIPYYSTYINFEYRFTSDIKIKQKKITLINVGTHSIYKN